jgi:hypothetical protein
VSSIALNVPADQRWVIRGITLFYPGAVTLSSFQASESISTATWWKDNQGILTGAVFVSATDLRIVLEEGTTHDIVGSGDPDVGLYGYALTLP